MNAQITVTPAAGLYVSESPMGTSTSKPGDLTPEELALRTAAERRLWWWNLGCGVLHLIQAIAVLAIGLGNSNAGKFRIPLSTNFLSWQGGAPTQQLQQGRIIFPFCAVTSGFAWLSALFHGLVLLFWKKYLTDLRNRLNQFRWLEYSLSSSLMIVLIAILFGVWDINLLFVMGSINGCMNLFGLLQEVMNPNPGKTDWRPFVFGCFAGIVPWIVIFVYIGSITTTVGGGSVPGFVWGILIAYLITFNTFPVNMAAQIKEVWCCKRGRWGGAGTEGYYKGEIWYQILSLVAKTLLLWITVGGTNQPNNYSRT